MRQRSIPERNVSGNRRNRRGEARSPLARKLHGSALRLRGNIMKILSGSQWLVAVLLGNMLTANCPFAVAQTGLLPFGNSSAGAIPAPPMLLAPEDGASVANMPTFSWSEVAGASSYSLQVAEDSGFSKLKMDQKEWPGTSVPLTSPLQDSIRYYWRVRSESSSGPSAWSSIRTLTKKPDFSNAITMISPLNNVVLDSQSVTFSWHPSSLAESYTFKLWDISDYCGTGGDCREIPTGKDTVIRVDSLRNGISYGWKVIGNRSDSVAVSGESRGFLVDFPIDTSGELPNALGLISPSEDVTLESVWVTFSWHPSNLVDSYSIDLCEDGDGCRGIFTGKDTVITVGPLQKWGYRWQVTGIRSNLPWKTTGYRHFQISSQADTTTMVIGKPAAAPAVHMESGILKYRLSQAERVRVRIFDVQGRLLSVLVDHLQNAGSYSLKLPAAALGNGIQFVDFRAGAQTLRALRK